MASTTSVTSTVEFELEPIPAHASTSKLTAPSTDVPSPLPRSHLASAGIIVTLAGTTILTSLTSGILTVALPTIGPSIGLQDALLLWPASVFGLACGCSLLIFGAAADALGSKPIWYAGLTLLAAFTFAAGAAQSGIQLIVFRVFTGIAAAMCLPTAVGFTTSSFPPGRTRNVAFATIGLGQPLGFAVGLVLGGAITDSIGWRWGFYVAGIATAVVLVASIFTLPSVEREKGAWRGVVNIDWIGAALLCVSFAVLSYVLAQVSINYTNIRDPVNAVLLVAAVLLLPTFAAWQQRQTRCGRPALIPNSIWRNKAFAATCACVFLANAALTAFQYFVTLYFENVQGLSALSTSIRLLPCVVAGLVINVLTGYLVDKVDVRTLVVTSSALVCAAPLVMAVASPGASYWATGFLAVAVAPFAVDVLFTVSNLIITGAFAGDSQSLAGGIFNAIAQMAYSVGLSVCSSIAASVTATRVHGQDVSPEDLLFGYRAAFWTVFAGSVLSCAIAFVGLGQAGKVGLKRE